MFLFFCVFFWWYFILFYHNLFHCFWKDFCDLKCDPLISFISCLIHCFQMKNMLSRSQFFPCDLMMFQFLFFSIQNDLLPLICFIFQKYADLFSIFTFRFLIKPFYFNHRFLCVIKKLYFFTCFFISGTVFYMQTDTAFPIFCDRIFYINFILFPLIFLFLPIHKKCHYLHWFQTFNAKSWLQIFCWYLFFL